MDMDKLDRRKAAAIIHSLADSGQPPKLGARHLNVGTDRYLNRIRDDYLREHLLAYEGADGGGACKWVEADYGNGKTQFLRCAQEQAWEHNFVTSFVELSQDECPLDRPELIYAAVARSIQARPLSSSDVDQGRGIEMAFSQLFDRFFPGILSGVPDEDMVKQAKMWLETSLAATPIDSSAFAKAVVLMLKSRLDGDRQAGDIASAFLRGEAVPLADLRSYGIYEKVDKSSGFRMIRSLCQLLQRSGLAGGTMLLFDEARRSLSLLSSRSQKVACENLLTVINKCNSGDFPGTMFLYAVMPGFFTDFVTDYPALQQRCGPATRFSLNILQDIAELDLLQMIGRKMIDIYKISKPDSNLGTESQPVLDATLKVVAEEVIRRIFGNGTRRLMVKTWAQVLRECGESGVRTYSAAEINGLMDGVATELDIGDKGSAVSLGE